mmetsp:Transcript_22693/g.28974  ORF Transcript_22693/g.28974 Transcript_22693/m.28974 type:complete len:147 (-) Transcript_22693:346-786(-)
MEEIRFGRVHLESSFLKRWKPRYASLGDSSFHLRFWKSQKARGSAVESFNLSLASECVENGLDSRILDILYPDDVIIRIKAPSTAKCREFVNKINSRIVLAHSVTLCYQIDEENNDIVTLSISEATVRRIAQRFNISPTTLESSKD